ncbi:MAG: hypothetical protein EHM13_00215, partial [Acidobacteria bacterium]
MSRAALRRHTPALLVFLFLTLLSAYRIVASLATAVPGWEGDNLYYVRSLWWMKHALFALRISPLFDPTAYFPVGHQLARSELTAANTILALPITALWGPVVAYNIVLLLSFVATGFGTYLWVTTLTGRRASGLLAGTIAALLPLRFAHLPGHLPQVTTQWIPFALYAFELFLARRSARRAVAMGLFAALVVLGCWYYGFALALLFPPYVALRTWPVRHVWREAAWWRGLAIAVLAAVVLVVPFLVPMLHLQAGGEIRRSLADMEMWSLNVYDFFLPNPAHPLWGDAVSRWFAVDRGWWVERTVAIGYVASGLALAGLFLGRPRRGVLALVVIWLASYLIALGPTLHSGDAQVRFAVPARVAALGDRA